LQAALSACFGRPSFANGARELDVLAIEGRDAVERDVLAVAVGHRVAIDLVSLLFPDIAIETAERTLVVERHRQREEHAALRLHRDRDVHGNAELAMVRPLLSPDLERLVQDPL